VLIKSNQAAEERIRLEVDHVVYVGEHIVTVCRHFILVLSLMAHDLRVALLHVMLALIPIFYPFLKVLLTLYEKLLHSFLAHFLLIITLFLLTL
jgi:hypothetical protein